MFTFDKHEEKRMFVTSFPPLTLQLCNKTLLVVFMRNEKLMSFSTLHNIKIMLENAASEFLHWKTENWETGKLETWETGNCETEHWETDCETRKLKNWETGNWKSGRWEIRNWETEELGNWEMGNREFLHWES